MFWNISDRVYLNVGEDFFQDGNCDLLGTAVQNFNDCHEQTYRSP